MSRRPCAAAPGEAAAIDAAAIERYRRDGFLVVAELFSRAEVDVLLGELDSDFIAGQSWDPKDGAGRTSRFAIWERLGDDAWGAAATCPRIVGPLRALIGEEIAFYHGKVIFKEPGASAAWEWHQDYGYWYTTFAFPRMASAWVALDPARKENGCLQVLRGSHRLGRIEHRAVGDQMGADPARVARLMPRFERVDCEVAPGSVIFFDANLLHASNPNTSADYRRSLIMCYSAQANPELVPGQPDRLRPPCPTGSDDGILRAAARDPAR